MNEWVNVRQPKTVSEWGKTPENMLLFCNALIRMANGKHATSICYKSHQSHLLKAVRFICHIEIPACLILVASSSPYANYNFSCSKRERCVWRSIHKQHSVAAHSKKKEEHLITGLLSRAFRRKLDTCYRKWENYVEFRLEMCSKFACLPFDCSTGCIWWVNVCLLCAVCVQCAYICYIMLQANDIIAWQRRFFHAPHRSAALRPKIFQNCATFGNEHFNFIAKLNQ